MSDPLPTSTNDTTAEPRPDVVTMRTGLTAAELTTDDSIGSTTTVTVEPDYWELSRQPLYSLIFSAPLLVLYELGVLWQSASDPRNGAEVWLRQGLDWIGLGQYYFLLPTLVIVVLLCWQYLQGASWRITPQVFPSMAIESLLLAVILYLIASTQRRWFPLEWQGDLALLANLPESFLQRLISFFGAGFYEEVLFRLLLVPVVMLILSKSGLPSNAAWVWSIVGTALLFAVVHHVGPLGDAWALRPLVFRTVAGIFFGVLFVWRGFGITAWSHALYDIIVGLW